MKIKETLERMADVMFSELFQAKALIVTFGLLGIACLIGAFWNPWQLMFAAMCGLLVWCGIYEYKKVKKHESKKGNRE